MLSAVFALVKTNDDVLDIALIVAVICALLAAFWQRRDTPPGAPHLGWIAVAALAFGLMFVTGP